MTPQALYNLFRSDVVDTAAPYLWSDLEVWEYLSDAFEMFVRLTDGIGDISSPMTQIPIITGNMYAPLDRRIIKIRRAVFGSTGRPLIILNVEDTPRPPLNDYGVVPPIGYDYLPGVVTSMVIGEQEGVCRWIQVPMENDSAKLAVWRMPLVSEIDSSSPEDALMEVDPRHHRNLLKWMRHRAYGKQDADTFNRGRSQENETAFHTYCEWARFEQQRQRSKVRITQYGGI
jgi:hypothetical protein